MSKPSGPLHGIRVLEIAGIGPGPFCGMILADLGADVVRVDRQDGNHLDFLLPSNLDLFNRGKRSITANFGAPDDVEMVLSLAERADLIIESFRPGVAERLGIGPHKCHERNPSLVYGRMTGWGQDGPLATTAGHDIDYIAISGPLYAIGDFDGPPQIPLSLVGDGPGGLYLVIGLLAGLVHARQTGCGQVVDAAIVDSSAHLMTLTCSLIAANIWRNERGANLIDGGAPFYNTYITSDGKYMAVGAVEPKFFTEFSQRIGLNWDGDYLDQSNWQILREEIARIFVSKTQEYWIGIFDGSDACVAPVLSITEAAKHPHNLQRNTFVDIDGVTQPAPTPRFSNTNCEVRRGPCKPGEHTEEIIEDWLD